MNCRRQVCIFVKPNLFARWHLFVAYWRLIECGTLLCWLWELLWLHLWFIFFHFLSSYPLGFQIRCRLSFDRCGSWSCGFGGNHFSCCVADGLGNSTSRSLDSASGSSWCGRLRRGLLGDSYRSRPLDQVSYVGIVSVLGRIPLHIAHALARRLDWRRLHRLRRRCHGLRLHLHGLICLRLRCVIKRYCIYCFRCHSEISADVIFHTFLHFRAITIFSINELFHLLNLTTHCFGWTFLYARGFFSINCCTIIKRIIVIFVVEI